LAALSFLSSSSFFYSASDKAGFPATYIKSTFGGADTGYATGIGSDCG